MTGSVTHAGLFVGAMIASRFSAAIRPSIAARAPGVAIARCAAQSASRPFVSWARSKTSEFQLDSGAPDSSSG